MIESTYALDNAHPRTGRRFASLTALYDPVTMRILDATGVRAGWRCLEVGAGGGSIATWLADRVGPAGQVLATDINPRWLDSADLSAVEVREHDITHDPLPDSHFDLIHARLVVMHLPERAAVLRRMVAALRPGGWLVIEDFDLELIPRCADGSGSDAELVNTVAAAFYTVLAEHGVDLGYARTLPLLFDDVGLTDIGAEGHVVIAAAGDSPAAELWHTNIAQTYDELIASALVTREDTERFRELLTDPGLRLVLPVLVAARGRRP